MSSYSVSLTASADKELGISVGDYRIVYEIDDTAKTLDVTRVAHRRDVYE